MSLREQIEALPRMTAIRIGEYSPEQHATVRLTDVLALLASAAQTPETTIIMRALDFYATPEHFPLRRTDHINMARNLLLKFQEIHCDAGGFEMATSDAEADAPSRTEPQVIESTKGDREKYFELLYAVETKHPNESRHETALRYIRQAEAPKGGDGQMCAKSPSPREEPTT